MKSQWTLLKRERKFSDGLVSLDHDRYRLESTGRVQDFTVIHTSDWVNVIPVTPEGKLVFIRQYRHGIREETLEIPGGAIDVEDADPRAAAERELREETGFEARGWQHLGCVTANPALQSNRCHTFLATEAVRAGDTQCDPFELTRVELLTREDAMRALREGTVHHALVLAAFGFYLLAGHDMP